MEFKVKWVILIALCFGHTVSGIGNLHFDSFYQKTGSNGLILQCKLCPRGSYLVGDCSYNGGPALCQECPVGTFLPVDSMGTSCLKCDTRCPGNPLHGPPTEYVTTFCTKTTNLQCDCKPGYWRGPGQTSCQSVAECAVGYGVKTLATSWSDTVCEKCTDGVTFSNVSSTSTPCHVCTVCPNGNATYVQCNIQADAVCERNEVEIVIRQEFVLTTANIIEVVFGVIGFILLIFICTYRDRVTVVLFTSCRREKPVKCIYTGVGQAGTGLPGRLDDDDDCDDTSITSRRHRGQSTTYGHPLQAGIVPAGNEPLCGQTGPNQNARPTGDNAEPTVDTHGR